MLTPNERITVEAIRRSSQIVLEISNEEGVARIRVSDRRFIHEVALALQSFLGQGRRICKKS